MIYSIIGPRNSGKTTLGKKLHNFILTESRNWRKTVFFLDEHEYHKIFGKLDNNVLYGIIEYLHMNTCDIVVIIPNYDNKSREILNNKFSPDIVEIFVHNDIPSDFETPKSPHITINTSKDSVNISFSKLIHLLQNY